MVTWVFDALIKAFCTERARHRHASKPLSELSIETLETRLVPAAVFDLSPTLFNVSLLIVGETAAIQTRIQNVGEAQSKAFRVEFRLSTDSTIDDQDILLKSIRVKKIDAGMTRDFAQECNLSAGLTVGHYYVGIVVDPRQRVAETDEINNTHTTDTAVPLLARALNGKVQFGNSKRTVSIAASENTLVPIDLSNTTWLVIHGRNGSSQDLDLVNLANVIDGYQPGDQVLLLDWSKAAASGTLGGSGENFIKPVANWAATALKDYGFLGKQLNLVGYSWGSYVAAEIAEQFGSVNSILSIEAARDFPGGAYNPEAPGEVDFAAHTDHCWAFFDAADIFGSPLTTSTADEAFLSFGSDHFKAVTLVTDILNSPQAGPIANVIPLSRLLTGVPIADWSQKTYDATGTLVTQGALFDAVIQTTTNGTQGESLRFFDGQQEQTVAV